MPWLFLVSALIGGWLTANVYHPMRKPAWLALASFLAGLLTTEFVVHHLLWQVAIVGAFVLFGGLADWPGYAALGVYTVSCFFLLRAVMTARAAQAVVDHALALGMPGEFTAVVASKLPQQPPLRMGLLKYLLPFRSYHPNVERILDIVYTEGERYRLKLDVRRRRAGLAGTRERSPVLLYVHGGGWVMGNKRDQGLPLVTHLASLGWVCVSANYRLSPRATFPEPLIDLKHAIAWIREHAHEYDADPDFIVVAGGSAGGHLASLLALTANDPDYQPGFEGDDTSVQGCVAFYGVYDFTNRFGVWPHQGLRRLLERMVMKVSLRDAPDAFERASPMARAHAGAPPFLVIHGDRDTMVPVEEARHFVDILRAKSKAAVVYAEVPGAQHAFEMFHSTRTLLVLHGVERFLMAIHAAYLATLADERPEPAGRERLFASTSVAAGERSRAT